MNVMLVDDYPLILSGLLKTLDWEAFGFPVVAQAGNGKQALAQLEAHDSGWVDIVFTDIRMPIMDGLQLIKELKGRYPRIRIAVLSAFDDFEQVRSAFQLGADDYLLKQEVSASLIKGILEKFRGSLLVEESRLRMEQKENPAEKSKEESDGDLSGEGYVPEELDRLLKELVRRGGEPKRSELAAISLPYPRIAVMQFTIETADGADKAETLFFSVEHQIQAAAFKQFSAYLFSTNYNEYNLVYSLPPGEAPNCTAEQLFHFLEERLSTRFPVVLTAGVSGEGAFPEDAPRLFEEASFARASRFWYGRGRLLFSSELKELQKPSELDTAQKAAAFRKAVHDKNFSALKENPKQWEIPSLGGDMETKRKVRALFGRYGFILMEFIENQNLSFDCDKLLVTMQFLLEDGSVAELNGWLMDLLEQLSALCEYQNKYVYLFRHYIREHYSESGLRVEEIAQALGISVGHMGKLIYQEMGLHFSDYLNAYRIERAKEMLMETTLKVYEVADQTGYNNVEHFTRVFKKLVGVNPTKYANVRTGKERDT